MPTDMSDATPSLKERRQQIRKEAILDVAREMFIKVGYEKTTLDKIGKAVGLSKQSLYYYVKSKEAVLLEICKNCRDLYDPELLAEKLEAGIPPKSLISFYINTTIERILSDTAWRLLAINLPFMAEDIKREVFRSLRYELDILEQAVKLGCEQGDFQVSNPRAAAHIIQGTVQNVAFLSLHDKELSNIEIGGYYTEILLGGLISPASG